MDKVYPRALVVNSAPFNKKSAIGITMTNLFRGWPKDKLAQICAGGINTDDEVCEKFLCLEGKFFGITRSIKKIQRFILERSGLSDKHVSDCHSAGKNFLHSILYESFNPYLWMELIPYRLSPQFWHWIKEFRPQLIYCEPYFINLGYIIIDISRRFNIPIVPHFTDDWLNTRFRYPRNLFIQRYFLLRNLRRILSRSNTRLVISSPMADEYSRCFGGEFIPFANCVEMENEFQQVKDRLDSKRKKKIVYIGGLHFMRWQPLLDIAKAVTYLNAKEGDMVEMLIITQQEDAVKYSPMFNFTASVKFGPVLRAEDVPRALREADILLHAESFDPVCRRLTHLSMSTKIPQYMAAGRPILAYGPPDGSSCRYVQECGCGLVVGSKDENALRSAISLLVSDNKLRQSMGEKGFTIAAERHSAENVREEFRGILLKAAKQNRGVE